MVAAFYKAGLEPWTVTISDLVQRRIDVSQFHGLAFCGGFSFGVGVGAASHARTCWIAREDGPPASLSLIHI